MTESGEAIATESGGAVATESGGTVTTGDEMVATAGDETAVADVVLRTKESWNLMRTRFQRKL